MEWAQGGGDSNGSTGWPACWAVAGPGAGVCVCVPAGVVAATRTKAAAELFLKAMYVTDEGLRGGCGCHAVPPYRLYASV